MTPRSGEPCEDGRGEHVIGHDQQEIAPAERPYPVRPGDHREAIGLRPVGHAFGVDRETRAGRKVGEEGLDPFGFVPGDDGHAGDAGRRELADAELDQGNARDRGERLG